MLWRIIQNIIMALIIVVKLIRVLNAAVTVTTTINSSSLYDLL